MVRDKMAVKQVLFKQTKKPGAQSFPLIEFYIDD